VAQRWDFQGPADLAIRMLDALVKDPWERIRISQEWNIRSDWLLDSYIAIASQRDSFTPEKVKIVMGGTISDDSLTRMAKVINLRSEWPTRRYLNRAELAQELHLPL